MNSFNINKRNILSFNNFLKTVELSQDGDNIEKGEAEITKKAMPGEADPKKGTPTLDKPKKEEGTHKVVDMTMSGANNGKGGRSVLDKAPKIKMFETFKVLENEEKMKELATILANDKEASRELGIGDDSIEEKIEYLTTNFNEEDLQQMVDEINK